MLQQVADFEKDVELNPELKSDQTVYEMSREEFMKHYWEKMIAYYKLNKEKYFYNNRGGTVQWSYLHPGTSPLLLHFQMFQLAIEKLASEE